MPQILFVCTANRYRSVIAAAWFKDELIRRGQGNKWNVHSAGTWTTDGMPAVTAAIELAAQIGLDIRKHQSRSITRDMLRDADLVLVMESGQKEALQIEFPSYRKKIFLLSEATGEISYDIPDPMTNPSNIDVVPEICELIHIGFDKICKLTGQ